MAENTRKVNIVIAASEDGSLAVSVNGANRKLRSIADAARSSGAATSSAFDKTGASINKLHGPLDRFSRQFKNVFNVAIAFEFIRAFSAIEQAMASILQQGIMFNAKLEQGAIALAGVLTSTRQYQDALGNIVSSTDAFAANIGRAATLQQELLKASITTLGTDDELVDTYRLILAMTKDQKATDEERLRLNSLLLNVSKIFGQSSHETFIEVRQILDAQRDTGQILLANVGSSAKQVRAAKEQGTAVQFLLNLFKEYEEIAVSIGNSFDGLTSTLQTFIQNITAVSFGDIFAGFKDIMAGMVDAFSEVTVLPVLLNATKEELNALGKFIGTVIINLINTLAEYTAALIDFVNDNRAGISAILDLWSTFTAGASAIISIFGLLITKFLEFSVALRDLDTTSTSGLTDVVDTIREIGNEVVGLTDITASAFNSILPAINEGMQNAARNFSESVKSATHEIEAFIDSLINELAIGIAGFVGNAADSLFSPLEVRIAAAERASSQMAQSMAVDVKSIISTINDLISNFSSGISQLTESLTSSFSERTALIGQNLDATSKQISTNFTAIFTSVDTSARSIFTGLGNFLSAFVAELFEPWDKRVEKSVGRMKQAGDDLTKQFSMTADAGKLLAGAFQFIYDVGEGLVTLFRQIFLMGEDVENIFIRMGRALREFLTNLTSGIPEINIFLEEFQKATALGGGLVGLAATTGHPFLAAAAAVTTFGSAVVNTRRRMKELNDETHPEILENFTAKLNTAEKELGQLDERVKDIAKGGPGIKDVVGLLGDLDADLAKMSRKDVQILPEGTIEPSLGRIAILRGHIKQLLTDLEKPRPSKGLDNIKEKIDHGARAALRFAEELAKVQSRLAELDISASGNPLQFFAAAEAEVMAELENNIAHAHKNAEAIATAHELAAEKMKLAYFDAIKAIIDYEDNLLDKTLAILDNSAKAVEGFNQAQRAGVDNRISALQAELGIIQQRDGTLERQIELLEEITNLQQTGHQIDIAGATASIALDRAKIDAIQTTIDKLEASLQLYPQIGAGVQEVNDKIAALKAEQQDLANGIDRYGIAIKNSATEMQNLGTVSRNTTNEMKQTVISLRGDVEGFIVDLATSASKGFKGLKDVLSNFSESLTRSFAQGFAKALTAKMNFDVVFKNNFSGLSSFVGGILSSIGSGFQKLFSFISEGSNQAIAQTTSNLATLGTVAGADFGQASVDAASIEWKEGWDAIGSGSGVSTLGAKESGTTWGTIFGSIAAAAAGNSFGTTFSSAIGLGKSGASRTGGKIGGTVGGIAGAIGASMLGLPPQVGAAIGSFFGNIIGSFFGSLFEHVKTKGSQIREGVEKWLKEIGVSFADAIDSSNYFFPETKKLADKMFGGDFLAASDEVLRKKAGPELATKLKTLFAFITADAAVKHGKPVEQTGISNANVLLSAIGLDPDVIQDAMDEIIKKGGITFDAMIKKFNELKRGKNISDPFFDEAIKATVDIFYGELPDAIGAAGLAVRTFAEDGTFDLEAFNKALEKSITLFEQLSGLTVDILISPTMGTDWEKDFEDSLDELRRKQIASKYLIDNEDRIFAGIDTSDGMSETEWRVYRRNVKAAREDILDLWAAEGLLPEPIEEAADAFADLSDEARRYAEILGNISIDPLQGLQDFEDRKTEIADEIADLQEDIDEINQKIPTMKTLRGKRELIIERDSLQADIDALEKEASQLTVGKALGKSIRNQIADNLRDNIKAAIIDAVITAAIIEPFMEQLNEYIAEALADGVISADELEHMIAMGDTAADKAEAAAERIGPDLEAIDRATDGIRTDLMDGGAALRDIDLSGPVEDSRRIKENLREAHTSVKEAGSSKTGGTQYEAYIGPGGVLRFRPIGPKTPGHAAGGPIAGSGSTDSVPAMLTPGEFVITKAMYAKHRDLVHMIHADKVNHFRSGGMVRGYQEGGGVFGRDGGGGGGGEQGEGIWQNILIGLLKDLFGRKTPIDDSLASMQESIHQLQIFLKNVDENWPHLARFKDTALEMIESLKAKMKEALDAILNPVDEFLGSIVGDPVGDIVKQYKELKQSLEDNRKALEASGVDVDSYLKRLAEALPKKIDEAIKAALSFVQDAIDSIQGNIDSLSGLVSDPFQQLADLTDKIAAKRTELLGAKTLEDRSRLSQELSEMLREQLDLAKTPFGESSQDFADLLARNRQEMEDLKAELKKEYDKREKELRDKAPTIVVEVLTPLKLKREDSKEFAESLEKSLNSDRRVIKRVEKIAEHVRRIGH